MNNLEELKEELLSQKSAIESKGGTVSVSNINPSPSEITTGINSIVVPAVGSADADVGDVRNGKTFFSGSTSIKTGTLNVIDTSVATATESDVTSGKTFYAGNDTLKTGTSQVVTGALANATVDDVCAGKTFYAGDNTLKTGVLDHHNHLKYMLYYDSNQINYTDRVSINMPSSSTKISKYMCWNNYNKVDFYFNTNITTIPSYAFYGTQNFQFPNFLQCSALKIIDSYAFYNSNGYAFSLQQWPAALEAMDNRAMQEIIVRHAGENLVLPSTLKRLGIYCFASTSSRISMGSLSIPSYDYYLMPSGLFYWISFNCDFTTPSCITTIGSQFVMRGSFNNVTITSNVTNIENYAFGSNSTDPVSDFHMDSITFLRTSPPTIGRETIAVQCLQNSNFRIYVPDESVNAYKAVSNLSSFSSRIVGLSERP